MRLFVKLSLICLLITQTQSLSYAIESADDVLAARYRQLQEKIKPEQAASRHWQLMETSKHYLDLTNEARKALQTLEEHAGTVVRTGMLFEHSFSEVKKFEGALNKINEHKSLKGFDNFMSPIDKVQSAVSFTSAFEKTYNNKNLPEGAKKTLLALQGVGAMFEKLGDVPVIGAALEGYGQLVGGLAGKINGMAGTITATKEYSFLAGSDMKLLKGLDTSAAGWVKTQEWHYGIPLVVNTERAPFDSFGKKGEFFLQAQNGDWHALNHDQRKDITKIIVDYQLAMKRPIDNKRLWEYFSLKPNENTKFERDLLADIAKDAIKFNRASSILGGVDDFDPKKQLARFTQIEKSIIKWHRDFRLPLTYKNLSSYIRQEYQNPGVMGRHVRRRAIDAYPEFGKYLQYLELNGDALSGPQLLDYFNNYRKGKHLIADLEVFAKDYETDGALQNGRVVVRHKNGTWEAPVINGRAFFEKLPIGKLNVRVYADGYEMKGDAVYLEPLELRRGSVTLQKEPEKKEPPPPKREEPKSQAVVEPEPVQPPPPQEVKQSTLPDRSKAAEECYARVSKKISELRAINQSQDPTSNSVTTVSLGKYEECISTARGCFDSAYKKFLACPPNERGTYEHCIITKSQENISCAMQELSCSEGKARAECGL